MTGKELDISKARVQMTVLIPANLHAEMNAAVTESGKTKRQWIADAIEAELKKQKRRAGK